MFEVRIKDCEIYPFDMNADVYFSIFGDDISDDYSTLEKAKDFCNMFNKYEQKKCAYIYYY